MLNQRNKKEVKQKNAIFQTTTSHNKKENKMKRFIALIITLALLIATPAMAKDVLLNATITKADTLIDKNGAQYVRLIVNETRALNGISYETEVPVMAFGSQVASASEVKAGDTLKAICNSRNFEDRQSYTILKILK